MSYTEYHAKYYLKNKERILAYNSEYKKKNKEKLSKYNKMRYRKKCEAKWNEQA